jgi:hypothetical protein
LRVGVKEKEKKKNRTPVVSRLCCRLYCPLPLLSFTIMGRGERDKVDTSLIVTAPRIPRPTARAQGLDPQEGLSAPKVPDKAKG